MALAKVTSKGQVTVPLSVRIQANLEPGTQLDFHFEQDGMITIRPRSKKLMDLRGIVKSNRKKPVSIAEMKKAIQRGAARKYK